MGCSLRVPLMSSASPAPPAVDHVVQFYDDDAVLIATLADYVGTGLRPARRAS